MIEKEEQEQFLRCEVERLEDERLTIVTENTRLKTDLESLDNAQHIEREKRGQKSLDILNRDVKEWRERVVNSNARYAVIGDSNARRVVNALRSNGVTNAYCVSTFLAIHTLLERVSGEGPPPSDDIERALRSEDACLLWMGLNE